MREFKFRAVVIDDDGDKSLRYSVWPCGNSVFIESGFWMEYESIMQYTGLKDKNGKEIYEGDIIEWWDSYGVPELGDDSFSTRAVVSFEDGMFNPACGLNPNVIEILGNIYENPELIKDTAQTG